MHVGLDIAQHQLTWDQLLARAHFAEERGFHGVWLFDHFKPLYGDPAGPTLEAWSLLAALAAATQSVRLGVLVTGVTYRHPSVLAAQAVTVDHVSGGRLDLGIGAAWFEQEHRELGVPFPPTGERARRLEEAIQVLRLLMSGERVSFQGQYYQLQDARYRPPPIQQPHPPIWIGADGPQLTLPITGRLADAWHGSGSVERLLEKWRIVEQHARRAGRDPSTIRRSTNLSISEPWDQVRARAEALRDAGFEYLIVSWPGQGQERVEEFTQTLMPAVLSPQSSALSTQH